MHRNETLRLAATLELRAASAAAAQAGLSGDVLSGTIPYGKYSRPITHNGRRFVEVIDAGAFARAVEEEQDVRSLFNHDANVPLGRTKAGTLFLHVNEEGLHYECKPPAAAAHVAEAVSRRDVDGSSFMFACRRDRWEPGAGPNGEDVRHLVDLDLFEVGPCTFVAYEDATAHTAGACRSFDRWAAERELRELTPEELTEERLEPVSEAEARDFQEHAEHGGAVLELLEAAETRTCFASHLGPWLIEPNYMREAVFAIANGAARAPAWHESHPPTLAVAGADEEESDPSDGLYRVSAGVAIIDLEGPIKKAASKFGGTSSVRTRRALRLAARDDRVHGVLLRIDSPGGQAAGTRELANDVRALDARKPVHAYIEDLGASAAYWIAAQARRVSTNATGLVGSIGTYAVVTDASERFKREGLKVHVVSTGEHKGAGTLGTKVTEPQLAEIRAEVEGLNAFFLEAVGSARDIEPAALARIADGRVFMGDKAKVLGLVDEVEPLEDAFAALVTEAHR